MRIKKIFGFFFISMLVITFWGGCKKTVSEQDQLVHYVEKENSKANKLLDNGFIFLNCKYAKGDSMIVYHLKVDDNRFDRGTPDSIKSNIIKDLKSPEKAKLTRLFIRNSLSVKYIFDFKDKELEILISNSELSFANN